MKPGVMRGLYRGRIWKSSARAEYNQQRMEEIFQHTRHDVTAFLSSVTEGLGEEGRWLHLGLTSSDVIDTALSLQLVEAAQILTEAIDELRETLKREALTYMDTPMMGRTHGIHAEPITFGLKLALWWEEMGRQRERLEHALQSICVGKISRTGRDPCYRSAQRRGTGVPEAGIRSGPGLQPNSSARPSRPLRHDPSPNRSVFGKVRHGNTFPSTNRNRRGGRSPSVKARLAPPPCLTSANPELSERICGLARVVRGHSITVLEKCGPMARAGHQPLLGGAHRYPGLLPAAGLYTGTVQSDNAEPYSLSPQNEAKHGSNAWSSVQPACSPGPG